MYMKNLNHKMTLRLDDELYDFVNRASELYRVSPSDFIRQCIGTSMFAFNKANAIFDNVKLEQLVKEGFENGEDRKTNGDNQL